MQKLVKLINKFNKVAGYKLNIQKSIHFFTVTMKYQKENVKKMSKEKKQNNKPHQGGERFLCRGQKCEVYATHRVRLRKGTISLEFQA